MIEDVRVANKADQKLGEKDSLMRNDKIVEIAYITNCIQALGTLLPWSDGLQVSIE